MGSSGSSSSLNETAGEAALGCAAGRGRGDEGMRKNELKEGGDPGLVLDCISALAIFGSSSSLVRSTKAPSVPLFLRRKVLSRGLL